MREPVESIGTAVEFACKRWPGAALLVVFLSPLWLKAALQLWKWSMQ